MIVWSVIAYEIRDLQRQCIEYENDLCPIKMKLSTKFPTLIDGTHLFELENDRDFHTPFFHSLHFYSHFHGWLENTSLNCPHLIICIDISLTYLFCHKCKGKFFEYFIFHLDSWSNFIASLSTSIFAFP